MKHLEAFLEEYKESIASGADYVPPRRIVELVEAILKDSKANT